MVKEGRRTAVVLAAEPGCAVGAALARRFAAEGMHVYVGASEVQPLNPLAEEIRRGGGSATVVLADAVAETQVAELLAQASAEATLEIATYVTSARIPPALLGAPAELLEQLWRRNVYGAFLLGREAGKIMLPQRHGTILFAGSAAEPSARPPYTPFAISKFGLRVLVQGMAKEFAPLGVHVVDAVQEGGESDTALPKGVDPNDLVERCWIAHQEPANAWSHEIRC